VSCWDVYSCLFLTWVVVISWILELIVIVPTYTRNDSTLRERQIITIRLTSVSLLIIDNITGLKYVCVYQCRCVHAIAICCTISPSGSVSMVTTDNHLDSIHQSPSFCLSFSISFSLPAALLAAFPQWVKIPHSAIMLYWHECSSDIVASATKP